MHVVSRVREAKFDDWNENIGNMHVFDVTGCICEDFIFIFLLCSTKSYSWGAGYVTMFFNWEVNVEDISYLHVDECK